MPVVELPPHKPNKHPSTSTDIDSVIAELLRWADNREVHSLDSTPLDKAVKLLRQYRLMMGNISLEIK